LRALLGWQLAQRLQARREQPLLAQIPYPQGLQGLGVAGLIDVAQCLLEECGKVLHGGGPWKSTKKGKAGQPFPS
jgi:hypothetical protein